jgi:DNA primase
LTPIGAERDANRPRAETMIIWQRRFKSQISIVRLPEGKDPDELIRRDPASWSTVVASAQPFPTSISTPHSPPSAEPTHQQKRQRCAG